MIEEENKLIEKIADIISALDPRDNSTTYTIFALVKETLPELAKEAGYVKLTDTQQRILKNCSGHHL